MDVKLGKWEESYSRQENFMFYPKEEYVKFLNRFIRKRIGINKFVDVLDFSNGVKALDFGCGIGRLTCLMKEFGIEAYGVDISNIAIKQAIELSEYLGFEDMKSKFHIIDGISIPFTENYFDITISEGVFDSMSFELAKQNMKEINRVTAKLAFISLISGDDSQHYREYRGEDIVKSEHEKGTIQSFFNAEKIRELIKDTNFKMKWCRLISEESIIDRYKYGRYYIVLEK